ncbi:MAG: 16S rRNA (cytosine(1402)-N(4))-methyltransferase RsmH [Planctomycetes bacterium]|nr:16S rRNA (cytosine(1402)-N(4))-methyltransferase RsmH [Planctomycetota bacterium]
MAEEVLDWLNPSPSERVVDGTCGGGGHTALLAERVGPEGRVVALDRDLGAVERARVRFREQPVQVEHTSYCQLADLLALLGWRQIDKVLLDLGLSSDQLAADDRGFSFDAPGELDMRFDVTRGEPAWRLLQHTSERDLADLIYRFGEERLSRRIARAICQRRGDVPHWSAREFADLVRGCYPRGRRDRIDPATRTFQALRIAVNEELQRLEDCLRVLPDLLVAGGRVAIISFHSLEDRIVKWAFRNDDRWEVLTRKPVTAGTEELNRNPRSRSAKLRVAQRR